ncbi:hypothetical protein BH09ACT4_BH09ACT4_09220 [soil metagenome]
MLAVAAGLWFLYLVPTWIRRREYLATERTATRLQQTMRVMAETAEIPEAMRISATAREAARAERMFRAQQRLNDKVNPSAEALRRQRMRRTRRLASLLMVGATLLGLGQIWLMATAGVTLGAWLVLAATLAAGGVAIAVQRRLDVRAMPRLAAPRRSSRSGIPAALLEGVPARPMDPAPWTPVAVPQPLYLSKPPVQRAAKVATPQVEDVRPAAAVTPLRTERPEPVKSGFAAMGIVDPADTSAPDLDEVLRRRRSAG